MDAEQLPTVTLPRVNGVSRMIDAPRSIAVHFTREPTDDELRALHELVRAAALIIVLPEA